MVITIIFFFFVFDEINFNSLVLPTFSCNVRVRVFKSIRGLLIKKPQIDRVSLSLIPQLVALLITEVISHISFPSRSTFRIYLLDIFKCIPVQFEVVT